MSDSVSFVDTVSPIAVGTGIVAALGLVVIRTLSARFCFSVFVRLSLSVFLSMSLSLCVCLCVCVCWLELQHGSPTLNGKAKSIISNS